MSEEPFKTRVVTFDDIICREDMTAYKPTTDELAAVVKVTALLERQYALIAEAWNAFAGDPSVPTILQLLLKDSVDGICDGLRFAGQIIGASNDLDALRSYFATTIEEFYAQEATYKERQEEQAQEAADARESGSGGDEILRSNGGGEETVETLNDPTS